MFASRSAFIGLRTGGKSALTEIDVSVLAGLQEFSIRQPSVAVNKAAEPTIIGASGLR